MRIEIFGSRVWGSGFRVQGIELRVWGGGFRVQKAQLSAHPAFMAEVLRGPDYDHALCEHGHVSGTPL